MKAEHFANAMIRYAKVQPFGAPDFSDQFVCKFWFDQLGDLGPDALGTAMTKLVAKGRFPSIDQVKQACGQIELDDESLARDAVKRIENAIRKYGYIGWDKAREYIGSLGEHLVGISGGWEAICDIPTEQDLAIKMAQLREYAKVAIKKDAAGQLDLPPSLPSKRQDNPALALIQKTAQAHDLTPSTRN